jgi:plastocyanin
MTSGKNKLALVVAVLALLAGTLAAPACGGGSNEKATPAATSAPGTPKATAQATQTVATPKATQAAATPQAEGASVEIKNFAFDPNTLTIAVGQTVTWTNQDSATHTVVGDGGIDSGDLSKGDSYSKTFDMAGTFDYHCSIHPQMKGQVIVWRPGVNPANPSG